jgi:hypothetical protein
MVMQKKRQDLQNPNLLFTNAQFKPFMVQGYHRRLDCQALLTNFVKVLSENS